MKQAREGPTPRLTGTRLVPIAALLMIVALSVLGRLALLNFNSALEPELDTRSRLIGSIVRENIQRALDAGIPLRRIPGAESYLADVLETFPEVRSVQILAPTGDAIFGMERERAEGVIVPYSMSAASDRGRFTYRSVMLANNAVAGVVVIEIDDAFVQAQFNDVLLDLGVLILVILLVAFELIRATLWFQVTRPMLLVATLASQQARDIFSGNVSIDATSALGRLGARLSFQAEDLHRRFGRLASGGRLRDIGERHGIGKPPSTLAVRSVADVRLALFLFAVGEELSKSFLPVLVRNAVEGSEWLDPSLLVTLPIVAYLLALMIVSPIGGAIAERFPPRTVFVAAIIPVAIAQVGLSFASTLGEFAVWRGIAGVGYALATVACQDYALQVGDARDRRGAMSDFVASVFGGTFCGTAVGGVMADRLGTSTTFVAGAGLVIIAALLALRLMSSSPAEPRDGAARLAPRGGLTSLLRNPAYLALVIGIAVPMNIMMASFVWYIVPLSLSDMGLRAADIGRVLMLYYLSIILVAPIANAIADRWSDPGAVVAVGAMVSAGGLLALTRWFDVVSILAAIVAAGVGHGCIRAMIVSAVGEAASTDSAAGGATALAALRGLERGGSILGLLGTALVVHRTGFQPASVYVGWLTLAGAMGFALSHILRRRTVRGGGG